MTSRRTRILLLAGLLAATSCRSWLQRPPPADPSPRDEPAAEPGQPPETGADASPEDPASDSLARVVAAIIDSVEAEVRDSVAAARRDSLAARARRDSLAEAARRDSVEAARRDSIAAAARRDSIEAARRDSAAAMARSDSLAAAARRDSLAEVARQDSNRTAEIARQDSIEAAAERAARQAEAREDSVAAALDRAGVEMPADDTEDVEELRALGPAYIPYDRGPRTLWDTEAEAMVARTLLPVVRAEDLPARTRTYFWLLIRADGTVADIRLQTSSGNDAFDQAATDVVTRLRFIPAIRGERAVPTWVVRDISLLMR